MAVHSHLYNGMIAPLMPGAIRGVAWYQGESNVFMAHEYETCFGGLIESWREGWGQGDFPFMYVQIAPWEYNSGATAASAYLRDSQRRSLKVPHTGMAVTMDIGDPANIHPTNKRDVGQRLGWWALAETYGHAITYSGPLYRAVHVEGSQLRIAFDHTDGGLALRTGATPDFFLIAGADRNFVPATALIEANTIVVQADGYRLPRGGEVRLVPTRSNRIS